MGFKEKSCSFSGRIGGKCGGENMYYMEEDGARRIWSFMPYSYLFYCALNKKLQGMAMGMLCIGMKSALKSIMMKLAALIALQFRALQRKCCKIASKLNISDFKN